MTVNLQWPDGFRTVYDQAKRNYERGAHHPDQVFDASAKAFLATMGCSPRELFDLVEDDCRFGEPDFATSFELTEMRRNYFLNVQKGVATARRVDMDRLPAKSAAIEGVRWLPRIIEKAKAKLRGEMPEELMYCCGGDRDFLRSAHMTAGEFLRLVQDSAEDTQKIIATVISAMGRG